MMLPAFVLLLLGKFWSGAEPRLAFKLLVLGFFCCLAPVQGPDVDCEVCELGPLTQCTAKMETCNVNISNPKCFVGLGRFGEVQIMQKGCLTENNCNKVVDLSYTVNNTPTPVPVMQLCCEDCTGLDTFWNSI